MSTNEYDDGLVPHLTLRSSNLLLSQRGNVLRSRPYPCQLLVYYFEPLDGSTNPIH